MENNNIDYQDFDYLIESIANINNIDENSIIISINEGFVLNYLDLIKNSNCNFVLESISEFNPDYQYIKELTEEYLESEDDNLLYLMEATAEQEEKNEKLFKELPKATRERYDSSVEYPYPGEGKFHQLKDRVTIKFKKYKDWAKENKKAAAKNAGYAAGAAVGLGFLAHRIAVLRRRMATLREEERNANYKRKGIIRRLIEKIKNMINRLLGRRDRLARSYGR